MERKDHIDLFGATALIVFGIILSFNQVVIKVTNGGFAPVYGAGLRSLIGLIIVGLWIVLRRNSFGLNRRTIIPCLISGVLFSFEFICLYISLDVTSVVRASILYYSMPVWLAIAAHFMLPGETLSTRRCLGLLLAMGGVAIALSDRQGGQASWIGDLAGLGAAVGWAGIALLLRITPLREMNSESQLFWQLLISAPILLLVAPLFGPLTRDPQMLHVAGLLFQSVFVVAVGYIVWFQLIKIYPASGVASFSFLSPVFSVILGWLVLGEEVGANIWIGLVFVAVGVTLINRRRQTQVPQKV